MGDLVQTMGQLAPALSATGTILSASGQLSKGNATVEAARRRQVAAEREAVQHEQLATEAIGSSQVQASIEARNARYIQSTAIARAAASGAGVSDPTVVNILAKLSTEGAYRQAVALYQGEREAGVERERAYAARYDAASGMADAQAAQRASKTAAISTLIQGGAQATSLYAKYWTAPEASAGATLPDDVFDVGPQQRGH